MGSQNPEFGELKSGESKDRLLRYAGYGYWPCLLPDTTEPVLHSEMACVDVCRGVFIPRQEVQFETAAVADLKLCKMRCHWLTASTKRLILHFSGAGALRKTSPRNFTRERQESKRRELEAAARMYMYVGYADHLSIRSISGAARIDSNVRTCRLCVSDRQPPRRERQPHQNQLRKRELSFWAHGTSSCPWSGSPRRRLILFHDLACRLAV